MITKRTIAAAEFYGVDVDTMQRIEEAEFLAMYTARRAGAEWPDALKAGMDARAAAFRKARTVAPLPSSGMVGPRCVDAEDEK